MICDGLLDITGRLLHGDWLGLILADPASISSKTVERELCGPEGAGPGVGGLVRAGLARGSRRSEGVSGGRWAGVRKSRECLSFADALLGMGRCTPSSLPPPPTNRGWAG